MTASAVLLVRAWVGGPLMFRLLRTNPHGKAAGSCSLGCSVDMGLACQAQHPEIGLHRSAACTSQRLALDLLALKERLRCGHVHKRLHGGLEQLAQVGGCQGASTSTCTSLPWRATHPAARMSVVLPGISGRSESSSAPCVTATFTNSSMNGKRSRRSRTMSWPDRSNSPACLRHRGAEHAGAAGGANRRRLRAPVRIATRDRA